MIFEGYILISPNASLFVYHDFFNIGVIFSGDDEVLQFNIFGEKQKFGFFCVSD